MNIKEDFLWSDSHINKIEIIYDEIHIYIWNDYISRNVLLKCYNCVGVERLFLWDETIIEDIDIKYKTNNSMINATKEIYSFKDTCSNKSLYNDFIEFNIKLINNTNVCIICQSVELLFNE